MISSLHVRLMKMGECLFAYLFYQYARHISNFHAIKAKSHSLIARYRHSSMRAARLDIQTH